MTQESLMNKKRIFPILDIFRSRSLGSYYIIVSRLRPTKKVQCILVLIDTWKMGLKDCIVQTSMSRTEYKGLISYYQNEVELERISLEAAHWHIQHGLRIARAVKTHIPKIFFKYDYILGDYTRIEVSGSLYKCYLCEKGELSEEEVDIIKKIAKNDIKKGLCGTQHETPIFFTCQECKKEEFQGMADENGEIEFEKINENELSNMNNINFSKKIGRNEPCYCGSGLKYKKCHLAIDRKSHKSSRNNFSILKNGELIKELIQGEKEHMLSELNFDDSLRAKVEELFNVNQEGIPFNMEPVFFSTAKFKINDPNLAMKKIEKLSDISITDEDENGRHYIWTRAYPKGHWSPMSDFPGARQIIGDIQINFDKTMVLETRTKGWMARLIFYMIDIMENDMLLINLKFENPLDLLK